MLGVGAHLGHEVVVNLSLDRLSAHKIDVILMSAQVSDLGGGHQASRRLRLGQSDPQAPPQAPFIGFAP